MLFGGECQFSTPFYSHCTFADTDECFLSPCLNNGTCIDRVARYSCLCQAGFTGQNCERGMRSIHAKEGIITSLRCALAFFKYRASVMTVMHSSTFNTDH